MSNEGRRQSPIMLALNLMEWRGKFIGFAIGSLVAGLLFLAPTMANINDQLTTSNYPDHHWSVWPLLILALSGFMFALAAGFTVAAVVAHSIVAIMDLPLPPKDQRATAKAEQVNWYGSGNR